MKIYRIKYTLSITISMLFFTYAQIQSNPSFEQQWITMQHEYQKLEAALNETENPQLKKYCHSCWENNRKIIRQVLLGAPNERFLHTPVISGSMVRHGNSLFQKYEKTYLLECVSPQTKKTIATYQDTSFGLLPKECAELNCSTSTLGALFYAAKILETPNRPDIKTLVDFGGGYGNLARVFKKIIPNSTVFIIDLPELLALQFLFLQTTLPDTKILIHDQERSDYETGAIHLIPIYLFEKLNVSIDLFISTFALSETPLFVQDLVARKNFCNAPMCYITGQLQGWNGYFEQHNTLLENIRKSYNATTCQPFHHMLENSLSSYEIIGIQK